MRILFWGTPSFAVPSLRALLGEGHDVVGVVTQPDRPAGRGRKLRAPPVKVLAEEEMLPVLQPEKPRGEDFERVVRALDPEVSVVVAYGQILRPEILALPPRGSLNLHASILPELRGAAPINWAIIRGYEETGVTVMRMVQELDAGPILFQVREPIGADESASELTARMAEIGAEALVEALALLEIDELPEREQDHDASSYAPRITSDDARVDWSLDAGAIARHVRGMDDVPGAWTTHDGRRLLVYRPRVEARDGTAGEVLETDASGEGSLIVGCGAGALRIGEVKPEGKRRMTAGEWLRGGGARVGDRLGD